MKNFTNDGWKECLPKKEWEKLGETEDVEKMAKEFTEIIVEALDECAPVKRFKISQHYKSGLTKETKEWIRERDKLRSEIKNPQMKIKFYMKGTKNSKTESPMQ